MRIGESKLKLGRYLFMRHGGKVVFFGRFVGIGLHQGIDGTQDKVKASGEALAKTVVTSFAGLNGLNVAANVKVANGLPSLNVPVGPIAAGQMPSVLPLALVRFDGFSTGRPVVRSIFEAQFTGPYGLATTNLPVVRSSV